jgi:hypothetical protein
MVLKRADQPAQPWRVSGREEILGGRRRNSRNRRKATRYWRRRTGHESSVRSCQANLARLTDAWSGCRRHQSGQRSCRAGPTAPVGHERGRSLCYWARSRPPATSRNSRIASTAVRPNLASPGVRLLATGGRNEHPPLPARWVPLETGIGPVPGRVRLVRTAPIAPAHTPWSLAGCSHISDCAPQGCRRAKPIGWTD